MTSIFCIVSYGKTQEWDAKRVEEIDPEVAVAIGKDANDREVANEDAVAAEVLVPARIVARRAVEADREAAASMRDVEEIADNDRGRASAIAKQNDAESRKRRRSKKVFSSRV